MKIEKIKNKLSPLIIASFATWFACVLVFASTIFVIDNQKSQDVVAYIFFGSIFLGVISFGVGLIATTYKIQERNIKKTSWFVAIIKIVLFLAILPLFLLWNILSLIKLLRKIKSAGFRQYWKKFRLKIFVLKVISSLLVLSVILPLWGVGYLVSFLFIQQTIKQKFSLIESPLAVVGTGSMYPTWPKGVGNDPKELRKQIVATSEILPYPNGLMLWGKRIFGYEVERGDIITVEDDKTRKITEEVSGVPAGLLKRVIALAGDSIELRDGIVYLNDKPLKEPYIAEPRSTFGESFLKECVKITVPENSIFIMGDNRKGSGDSRELGFFSLNDVDQIIPLEKQRGVLDKNWHNTAHDLDDSSIASLEVTKYVDLLNEKRKESGLQAMKYQPKLEQSSRFRGEIMLKYADFSFDADKSGYDINEAMHDAGYSNIVYGELSTQGYYTAEELIENQFEFPNSKKFLLSREYQEIGISVVRGEMNGCPTQVIVQHLAGYVPPNYKQSDIDSWKKTLARLKEIRPGWEDLRECDICYKENKKSIDRINKIISTRISNIKTIISRMEANQWLTTEEQGLMDRDENLASEQDRLASKLNK